MLFAALLPLRVAEAETPTQALDVLFVLDTSESSERASGTDADGDGRVGAQKWALRLLGKQIFAIRGLRGSDPNDSVLAAEVAAAQTLLLQLGSTARIGVITYAGHLDGAEADAVTRLPLTSDREAVGVELRRVLEKGSAGLTNLTAAIRLAAAELLGAPGSASHATKGARRVIALFTDGRPTLPVAASAVERVRLAVEEARLAAKHGIRIDTYGIGSAMEDPSLAAEIAKSTGGSFTPVWQPRQVRASFLETPPGVHPEAPGALQLELSLLAPGPDSVVGGNSSLAFIAGRLLERGSGASDVLFAIDSSQSTDRASGTDVDGDGYDDTVLAAEVATAHALLAQLDPVATRVGVITFAGDPDRTNPDAVTRVPLTNDFGEVSGALRDVLALGPSGMTNIAAAVSLATEELLGTGSAGSKARAGARLNIILFTDGGVATLPRVAQQSENERLALSSARKAAKKDIRIDVFTLGPQAATEGALQLANVTGGTYVPVVHPREAHPRFVESTPAHVEIQIRNLSTQQGGAYEIQDPDGGFAALVPVREGENRLEIYARAAGGVEARATVNVRHVPGATQEPLPPELVPLWERVEKQRLSDESGPGRDRHP